MADRNKDPNEMSFLEHLEELRWHLIRSLVAVVVLAIAIFIAKDWIFRDVIFGPRYSDFISYRLMCGLGETLGLGERLCFTPPEFETIGVAFGELFITHMKVSLVIGFVAAFPYIFWEFWKFIRPGLHEHETKAIQGIVFICSSLFLLGVAFGYFVISPFAINFLGGYQIEGAVSQPSIGSYVNYMTMFTIPTGLVFELPIVIYFLSKIGIVTPEFMKRYRRHAFVLILILASIITPPDVMTQFLIGIPLYVLYEISIYISKRVTKKEAKKLELQNYD
jgi:sec-independent protein translocase protein TatC